MRIPSFFVGLLCGAAFLLGIVWTLPHFFGPDYMTRGAVPVQPYAATSATDAAQDSFVALHPPDTTTEAGRAEAQGIYDRKRAMLDYLHVACTDPRVFTAAPDFPRKP